MPKVSIILPVYNSEKYIDKTIKSIFEQTFTDWELIVIDDFSSDEGLRIIEELKNDKFIILKNDQNRGAAYSRNRGINVASGRFIAFVDSDDIWRKDKLEKQINFMEEKKIGFSFTSYERVKENGELLNKVDVPEKITYDELLRNTIILNSTVVFDTEIVDKSLIRMPEYKTSEDTAMFLSILRNGHDAYGLNDYLIKYTVRKNSLSSNKFTNMLSLWKVYKECENLNYFNRTKSFLGYIHNAFRKRIPKEKIRRISEIKDLITIKEFFDILFFPFIFLISLCARPFLGKKNIWIIEECPSEACDNGYIFYKYLRGNRKDINAYYVIRKGSKDYEKAYKLGNVINHGSLKHWIYYLNAKKIIVTQKYANPSPALFHVLHKKNILKSERIFLQHGITKDDAKMFYYNRTNFRLFICGAEKEYEYIKNFFRYPHKNVVYTGFARFDNLNVSTTDQNNFILITPTWRKWIKTQNDFNGFIQHYYDLVQNEDLTNYLSENNINIKIVLHKNMKKFKIDKNLDSKYVSINHNDEVDIQDLLNKADLLITDYSSIFMDIAYRQKPIIYYQFDKEKYRENQLQEGYFLYENDGFGEVVNSPSSVVEKVKYYINNKFKVEEKYLKRMIKFFRLRDKNNCKRILDEIEKL